MNILEGDINFELGAVISEELTLQQHKGNDHDSDNAYCIFSFVNV